MNNAIEMESLQKSYPGFKLELNNLTIPSGIITGIIGENGAGKTTFIKALLNIIKADKGSIKIFNKDLTKEESLIKEDIGVVLDGMFFPELLNSKDINSVMKGVYKSWDSKLFNDYLEEFGINPKKMIKDLSKGMRKKLEIATALSHKPKLLILDEPTSGLDPVVRSEVLDIFLDFIKDESHTILLSTHITSDLEHIADRIIFIDKGRVIGDHQKDDLIDNYGILKCDLKTFSKIDKEDIASYKKNKYDVEILVKDKHKMQKKYKDCIVDKITLEDLMVLMIKGEK